MGLMLDEKRYAKLLVRHAPRRIDTQAEYDHWADWLEGIRSDSGSTPEDQALGDLVTILLEEFDRREHPELQGGGPIEMLHFCMEKHSMKQADLSRLLGVSRATGCNIYGRKQGIYKRSAMILARHFRLPVSTFLEG